MSIKITSGPLTCSSHPTAHAEVSGQTKTDPAPPQQLGTDGQPSSSGGTAGKVAHL